jgi:hypothetical protein
MGTLKVSAGFACGLILCACGSADSSKRTESGGNDGFSGGGTSPSQRVNAGDDSGGTSSPSETKNKGGLSSKVETAFTLGGTLNTSNGGTLNTSNGGTLNTSNGGTLNTSNGGTLNTSNGGTSNATSGNTIGGNGGSGSLPSGGSDGAPKFVAYDSNLSVSTSFYLHTPRSIQPATDFIGGKLACTESGCLVAYGQKIGGREFLLASRVTKTGVVLDKIVLANYNEISDILTVDVAANSSGYLVYAITGVNSDYVHEYRSLDAEGKLLKASTDTYASTNWFTAKIWGGKTNFLVVYGDTNYARVLNPNLERVGPAITDVLKVTNVVVGPSHFLITSNNSAVLVDELTGQSNGLPQSFWTYGNVTASHVGIYVDGSYVVMGTRLGSNKTYDTYAIRFDSQGILLDPDDSFNLRSGGILMCEDCGDIVESIFWLGDSGLATIGRGSNMGTFRFTMSPFARVGTSKGCEAVAAGHRPKYLANFGDHFLGMENALLKNFTIKTNPMEFTFHQDQIIVPRSVDISEQSVAYVSSRYLVSAKGMTPTFVNDKTGILEEVTGVGSNLGGQVADDDVGFLLTQQSDDKVVVRKVSVNGVISSANSLTPMPIGNYRAAFRLTSNKQNYFLTASASSDLYKNSSKISGIRIAKDGTFLDQGQEVYDGADGYDYIVAADWTPTEAYRTFGLFVDASNSWRLMRVRSATGVIIPTATKIGGIEGTPRFQYMSSDGSSFLSFYQRSKAGESDSVFAALMSPNDGTITQNETLLTSEVGAGVGIRGVGYDGRSYLLGLMATSPDGLYLDYEFFVSRFNTKLESIDPSGTKGYSILPGTYHPRSNEPTTPVLAGDHNGNSLMAYLYADPVYGGVTLRGVFIQNTAN